MHTRTRNERQISLRALRAVSTRVPKHFETSWGAREAGWRFAAKISISDYFFTFKLLLGHFRPKRRLVRMEGDTEIAELESDIRTLRKQLKEKVQQLKTLKKHFQKVSVVPILLNNPCD